MLARRTVNSLLPGIQKSQKLGAGQEFSQYRSYQPGDDLRRLDWKLFARSDRYFVREASLESNIVLNFVLDASASMRYQEAGIEKIDFARYLIATLAWLGFQNGDAVGLYAISGNTFYQLNPKPGRQYLQRFLYELIKVKTEGVFPKTIQTHHLPVHSIKKEILIFITDLYETNDEELKKRIINLKQGNREIIVMHLMGKNEMKLSFDSAKAFEDLETGKIIQVDIQKTRKKYIENLDQFITQNRKTFLSKGIEYQLFRMDTHIGKALKLFLKLRT